MRACVAGCAGFIGYHLSARLCQEGADVIGLDNLCTGQRRNVQDLASHPRFRFVEQDIAQPLPELGPLDFIYDMACPASPVDFKSRQMEILAVCSRGVWNLLDLAKTTGARFLQSSTSEVYGNPKVHPQTEDYWGHANPIGPRSCYDEGKRFAEALIMSHRARHGTNACIARIFNTYGPRMRADDGRALPNFITQALAGQPVTVHGDGSQTRSFCYVDDLVEGLLRLSRSDATGPINLGNPVEVSIREIAQEVVALCGSASTVSYLERPADDPDLRRPDITRARTLLGWEPTIDRATGLRRTIAWFAQEGAGGPRNRP